MKYARLGDSGLIVSRLSFGAMTFGSGAFKSVYKVGEDDAAKMIARALEVGINFFDTADVYADGQSESILGELLRPVRDDVVISTKVGNRTGQAVIRSGLSRRNLIASCDQSLKRLGTDYIDVYSVHKTDPYTPLEETLEALDYLVKQGKVRYVGYSNWPAWLASKAIQIQRERGYAQFISAQMYYSYVGRDLEHETVPLLEDSGIGLMVWSPLAGGFLSGKYTRENVKTDSDNRLSGFDFIPLDKEWGFRAVDHVREIAAQRDASPAQVALAWLLSRSYATTIIVGASKLSQLDDNLGAVELNLTDSELAGLDQLTVPAPIYPNWFTTFAADHQTADALSP